jgi:putative FmdB family regulatory protein
MPIYAYRCSTCGHAQDVLQKISDPVLSVCPACGAATYVKQVTAAGFQLKGSGWYVTDFRDGKAKKPADANAPAAAEKKGDGEGAAAAGDAGPAKSADAPAAGPAAAPAAAAAPASPAPPAGKSGS